jgi:hypothetical protein
VEVVGQCDIDGDGEMVGVESGVGGPGALKGNVQCCECDVG